MPTKQTITLIFSLILLVACGPALTPPTPSATHQTSATPAPPTAAPTETLTPTPPPTPTVEPVETTTPFPTASPSPAFTPEPTEPVVTVPGLRMAYIVDGNLYVQDSGGKPVQLTHSGADSEPTFSDDGQKLVFLRSENPDDAKKGRAFSLFSINADGSHERVQIVPYLLMAFGSKYDQSSEVDSRFFMPGTHRLLFNTRQIDPNGRYIDTGTNEDLLLLDTDSGSTRQILAPGQVKGFALSPNGQRLIVQKSDARVDITGLDGKIVRQDIFASLWSVYTPLDIRDYLSLSWSPDSNRVVAAPGNASDVFSSPAVWQYSMANNSTVQTMFEPSPSGARFAISPDKNWIVYTFFPLGESSSGAGIYLGDIRTGAVRELGALDIYGVPDYGMPVEYDWSPDSKHFYFYGKKPFVGDVDGNMIPIDCDSFTAWIDERHYMCGYGIMSEPGKTERVWIVGFPQNFRISGSGFRFGMLK